MKTNLRPLLSPALALMLLTALAGAQEAAPAAAAAAPAVHKKTLMDLFHEGGWVMYPIALASVFMIWFIVQGFISTSRKRLLPADHVTQLRELFKAGNYVVFDANIAYPWEFLGYKLVTSLAINNVTDKIYYEGNVAPGNPRTWTLRTAVNF